MATVNERISWRRYSRIPCTPYGYRPYDRDSNTRLRDIVFTGSREYYGIDYVWLSPSRERANTVLLPYIVLERLSVSLEYISKPRAIL